MTADVYRYRVVARDAREQVIGETSLRVDEVPGGVVVLRLTQSLDLPAMQKLQTAASQEFNKKVVVLGSEVELVDLILVRENG